jgi:hypothetical protein
MRRRFPSGVARERSLLIALITNSGDITVLKRNKSFIAYLPISSFGFLQISMEDFWMHRAPPVSLELVQPASISFDVPG